jgi:hypothetical protein
VQSKNNRVLAEAGKKFHPVQHTAVRGFFGKIFTPNAPNLRAIFPSAIRQSVFQWKKAMRRADQVGTGFAMYRSTTG